MANSNQPKQLAGVVGYFNSATDILHAAEKVRDANYQSFDCYTPFPIHGLEKAQGLKRSPLPYVTMGAGLAGLLSACALQYWTSVMDWPVNIGGKPMNSWPAFVPVAFELTVLFAGLFTVGAMFLINGLPNIKKRSFDANITRDKFAIMIDAPKLKSQVQLDEMDADEVKYYQGKLGRFKKFDPIEAESFLKSIGATEVKQVMEQGWFESYE